jgi:hypothetical protein
MERGTTSSGSTTTMAEMLEVVLINGSMIKGVLTLEVIMARQEVKATPSTTQVGGGGANPNMQYGNGGWLQEGD